jgi:hypothetical protein
MTGRQERLQPGRPDKEPGASSNPQAVLPLFVLHPITPRRNGELPSGPTINFDRPPYFQISHPGLRKLHDERRAKNRDVVEQLVAPNVQLTNGDVLELVAAYYLGYFKEFELYKDGLPYPPLPDGHWFAPIRTTYESIGDEKRIWTNLFRIPTVATLEEAVKRARSEGLEESSHAASRQINLVGVEVLLSGKLLPKDEEPQWLDIWLIPPEQVAKRTSELAKKKRFLESEGYQFPDS